MSREIALPVRSAGHALDAGLLVPEPGCFPPPWPLVVFASGLADDRRTVAAAFARALTRRGHAVATFDHRGAGSSAGPPHRAVPDERVADLQAVVHRAVAHPATDAGRVSLVGFGLGGGVAVAAAAAVTDLPLHPLHALAVVNGLGDGGRVVRDSHDRRSWVRLIDELLDGDRRLLAMTDVLGLPPEELGASLAGTWLDRESVVALLEFRPDVHAARLLGLPLLVLHGTDDRLHGPAEGRALHRAAPGPRWLELLDGAGHDHWVVDGDPLLARAVDLLDTFLTTGAPLAPRAVPLPDAGSVRNGDG